VLERPAFFAERVRGEIESVFVRPEARRSGVAHALLAEALDWLRGRGIERVALDVEVGNDEGAGFWRAEGFARVMDGLERAL